MKKIEIKKEVKPKLTRKQRFIWFVLILNGLIILLLVLEKQSYIYKICYDVIFIIASFKEIKKIIFSRKSNKAETTLEVNGK